MLKFDRGEKMICQRCKTENDEDAIYCKNCGVKLSGVEVCPHCQTENSLDSIFCKKCGSVLKKAVPVKEKKSKKNILSLLGRIFSFVSFILCAIIIVFNFGICFGNFFELDGTGVNLFEIIKDLQNIEIDMDIYNSGYYLLSVLSTNVLSLLGICVSMVGTFVVLVYYTVKAVRSFLNNKELISLERGLLYSFLFLLAGSAVVRMVSVSFLADSSYISYNMSSGYGPLLLSGFCLSLIWLGIYYVFHFVIRCIECRDLKELFWNVVHFSQIVLLGVILFNLGNFTVVLGYKDATAGISIALSSNAWLSGVSQRIFLNDLWHIVYLTDELLGSFIIMILQMVLDIALIAVVSVLFMKKARALLSFSNSSCLKSAISVCILSALALGTSVAGTIVYGKEGEALEYFVSAFGSSSAELSKVLNITVSASIIVIFIFSCFNLGVEITNLKLNKQDKLEVEEL